MITFTEAGIISTVMEGMLYGLSTLMFVISFWILFQSRKRRRLNCMVVAATVTLLLMSTAEFVVNIVRLFHGLIYMGPTLPGGPEEYFADLSRSTFTAKSLFYSAQVLILDAVVIYRAYAVWQLWYVIVVPVLGWLSLAVMAAGLCSSTFPHGNVATTEHIAAQIRTGRWALGFNITTFITNFSATCLLAYRIWSINRLSEKFLRPSPKMIIRVIIESGAIYSFTIMAAIIALATGSRGTYVMLDMVSPIICIVFNRVIVRVGFATEPSLCGMVEGGTTNCNATGLSLHFTESPAAREAPGLSTQCQSGRGGSRADVTALAIELT